MLNQMSDYEVNEKDIEAVIRYLKIHDPKNADRKYAVQLLGVMQEVARELVDEDITIAELIQKALLRKE